MLFSAQSSKSILSSKGITLIEILISVSIIALVSVISIPNFRRFSQSQELSSAATLLYQDTKAAQSSAQSFITCYNGRKSTDWVMSITNTGYTIKANCFNSANGTTAYENRSTSNFINGVGLVFDNPLCTNNAEIKFQQNNVQFSCGSDIITDNTFTLRLQKDGSPDQVIMLDRGGAIYYGN